MVRNVRLCASVALIVCGLASAPTRYSAADMHRRVGWLSKGANTSHAWLYATANNARAVNIYDLSAKGTPQIGLITDGVTNPVGIAIDTHGTLYVANSQSGNVEEYLLGSTSPSTTLYVAGHAQCVAVDSVGNVYVCSNEGNGFSSISVYAPGQTSPGSSITSGLIRSPNQIALDGEHNLYITDSKFGVLVVPQGTQNVEKLRLHGLANDASGIALGPLDGSFYISCPGPQYLYRYPSGQKHTSDWLRTNYGANFLAVGVLKGQQVVFAPDSTGSISTVYVYNWLLANPKPIITSGGPVQGVAFKPAGAL